ncbi:GNAT family N-acetyltransferase [Devosia sp.]|uniref:GNAT family N-acetyltransferase n=1 Tax=Devosia sp. TaxID=1871048 RepID=UPI003263E3AC
MKLKDVHWRAMSGYDMAAVQKIADVVHPGFFEAPEVLAERQRLYPSGCHLLEVGERPAGYVLSHPWRFGQLPALNSLLGQIPADADTYYLHDLALLPLTRGIGAANHIVEALIKHARVNGFPTMSLVAVNASRPFWEKHGFVVEDVPALTEKLASYEDAARFMVRRFT